MVFFFCFRSARSLIRQLSAFSTFLLIVVVVIVVLAAIFFRLLWCTLFPFYFFFFIFQSLWQFSFYFLSSVCVCLCIHAHMIYMNLTPLFTVSSFLIFFCLFVVSFIGIKHCVRVCDCKWYIESEMKYINQFLCVWTLCVCASLIFIFSSCSSVLDATLACNSATFQYLCV